MFVGAHVSIAGGFDKSIDRAVAIGAQCLQTFASSPRSLKTSEYDGAVIEKYLMKKAEANMGPHFFHGVYLINLATDKASYLQVCIDSLIFYQQFAGKIEGEGTIFHIGSHKGVGFEAVKKQVAKAIEDVLKHTPDGVKLFLENAAGHKGVIGADLHELRWLRDKISSNELRSKLGICYDTQHGFASGLDVRTKESLTKTLKTIDNQLGLEQVNVIHANDSKVAFNSQRDRHENIGEGEIGTEGFRYLVNHPRLHHLPVILEVPGEKRSGPRAVDIERLVSLCE